MVMKTVEIVVITLLVMAALSFIIFISWDARRYTWKCALFGHSPPAGIPDPQGFFEDIAATFHTDSIMCKNCGNKLRWIMNYKIWVIDNV